MAFIARSEKVGLRELAGFVIRAVLRRAGRDRGKVMVVEEGDEQVLARWVEVHNRVLESLRQDFSDSEINTFAIVAVTKMLKDTTRKEGAEYANENLLGTMSYLATSEEIAWKE